MEEEILQSSSHRVPAYFCILQFCFLCSAVKLWPCDAAAGRSHQANTRFFRRNSHRPCREPPPHSPDIPTELCSLQYSVVLLTFIQKHTDRHAHMLVQMSIFFLNVCFSSSSLFLGFSVPLFCVHGGVLFTPSSFFFYMKMYIFCIFCYLRCLSLRLWFVCSWVQVRFQTRHVVRITFWEVWQFVC